MRRLRVPALSAVALACGLALTGCSGATTTGSASGSSTDSATPGGTPTGSASVSASPSASSSADTSASASPSASSSASASGGSSAGSDDAGAGQPCRTAGLGFEIAPGSGAQAVGEEGAVVVRLTNRSGAACTLKGYPGVDLVGASTWSLPRQTSQKPRLVTLKPGARTAFTVTYQSYGGDGVELTPRTMVVTPPGETRAKTLTWTFSPVLLQDGATRPGSYVGPVGGN
ncbi:DUF4232 domain-containing protein [Streptomyces sp. NPDC101490]|uniref:DUF4232 domain-containing protein n=1 Tax=Streptomyces sp. NPDC101490 TaxID=3366143 RepID=UPI0038121968